MKKISVFALVVMCGAGMVLVGSGVIDFHQSPGVVRAAPGGSAAQLQYGVAGSGGGDMTSGNFGARGTVGQDGIGSSGSASYGADAGYWNTVMATATGAVNETDLPQDYALAQNYPNPFNPRTTIRFALPRGDRVKLRVFDVNGNLVATLADRELSAGVHDIVWDASGIASGIYFCRIDTPGFVRTRKLVLLK